MSRFWTASNGSNHWQASSRSWSDFKPSVVGSSRPYGVLSPTSGRQTVSLEAATLETAGQGVGAAGHGSAGGDQADEAPGNRRRRVEAVLLLAKTPLAPRKLSQMAQLSDATEARTLVRSLNETYSSLGRAIRVELIAGGYRMLTLPALAPWLSKLSHIDPPGRLSTPMMETLAVVAYRGPVSRAAVESVRGVACGELLRQLMDRDLVRIAGRSEELGRPYLYDTTKRFLQLFGLANKDALPPIKWQKLQEDHPEPVSPSDASSSDDSSINQKEPVVSIAVASMSATTTNSPIAAAIVTPEIDADQVVGPTAIADQVVDPAAVIEDEEDDLYEGVHEQDWDDEEEDDDWDEDDDESDDEEEDDESGDEDLDDDWEEVDEGDDDWDEDDADEDEDDEDWGEDDIDDEEDEDDEDEDDEDWD